MKPNTKNILKALLLLLSPFGGWGASSCTEPDSNLVSFVENNTLSTPNDTLYSFMGIINKMQKVADRTVVLGEIRGDLTTLTENATLELQDVANFNVGTLNPYNNARDYYAIIQNCNYYIAHADTSLTKRGDKVFLKEYAAIKAYRAWTYLQLALNYGSVPFFTEPLLTELDANPSLYPKYDVNQIAEYFIKDLSKLEDVQYPNYGSINGINSKFFYIPIRVLMGDLCLWSGKYEEAAQYYHDYLTKTGDIHPIYDASVRWRDYQFQEISDGYASQFPTSGTDNIHTLTIIPMEEDEYNGIQSFLKDIFTSTEDNNYYYQATHSVAYDRLSQSQKYTLLFTDPVTGVQHPISPADTLAYESDQLRGDLRQQSIYSLRNQASNSTSYSSIRQNVMKHRSNHVCIYRLEYVYLRYAEALNRAGYPYSAFAILKYGLTQENITKHVPKDEAEAAKPLISFSEHTFLRSNTVGLHSRGCGDVDEDSTYAIPQGLTKDQTLLFVENKICDEMALETATEGQRYYDLMRIALHRNDPSFLASKVAMRDGTLNLELHSKLCDKKNWYLTLE